MESVTQLNFAGAGPDRPAPEINEDARKAATDFESFLTLLTAQLRNQDPLQPIDSTQFVAQLASFSSVEQQVKTNDLLRDMTTTMAGNSPERLVGLIGAKVPAPLSVIYGDKPVEIRFVPIAAAGDATLVVRDDAGATVARLPVDAKSGAVRWDGTLENGFAVAGEKYRFEIEVLDARGVADSQPGFVFSLVTQIRFDTDGPKLGFAGGTEIALSEVLEIRSSDS